MEENKAFNNYQETYLKGEYVSKKTFYDYQKEQDTRIDSLHVNAEKTLSTFKVIMYIVGTIVIPISLALVSVIIDNLK